MYPNQYRTEYTSRPEWDDRCPVCGSIGECPDVVTVPMPFSPFDDYEEYIGDQAGPLRRYRVTVSGYVTVMQLNDSDAARYGAAAVPIS